MLASAANDGVVRLWDTGIRRLGSSLVVGERRGVSPRQIFPTDRSPRRRLRGRPRLSSTPTRLNHPRWSVPSLSAPTRRPWRGAATEGLWRRGAGTAAWCGSIRGCSRRRPARDAVLYTTVAHVGGGHTRVMWQGYLRAPSPRRAGRRRRRRPAHAHASRRDPSIETRRRHPSGTRIRARGLSFSTPTRPPREDAPPTPTMGDTNTREGTGGDVGVGSDLDERLREEVDDGLRRLMSPRGRGGTPGARRRRRGRDAAMTTRSRWRSRAGKARRWISRRCFGNTRRNRLRRRSARYARVQDLRGAAADARRPRSNGWRCSRSSGARRETWREVESALRRSQEGNACDGERGFGSERRAPGRDATKPASRSSQPFR